jgi:hypothetical protein
MITDSKKSTPFIKITLLLFAVIAFLALSSYLRTLDEHWRVRASSHLIACSYNLKNLAAALEIYSSYNSGHYPPSLAHLSPDYLETLPTCPEAKIMTYAYASSTSSDAYTAWCRGSYHVPFARKDYPKYDSVQGLFER